MAYNRRQAHAFLSDAEATLFDSSLADGRRELQLSELRGRIKRIRTLRDKSRDLLQRQKLATRERTGSKGGKSGRANERTEQKATAFDEALQRLEAELRRREGRTPDAPATVAPPKKAPTKRGAAKTAAQDTPARKTVKTTTKKTSVKKQATRQEPATVVLRRSLERKQAALEMASANPKAASGKGPGHNGPDTPVSDLQATPPAVRAAAVASRLADSSLSRIQAHNSSQVRRSQAKRDQR